MEPIASRTTGCPRCGGGIPNDYNVGAYPGALSRYDNKTEICSECGLMEALWVWTKRGPLPPPSIDLLHPD